MTAFKYDTLRDFVIGLSKRYSEKVAFQYYDIKKNLSSITYGSFLEDIEGVGSFLLKNGYESEKVAIISENSYDWIRLFFSITCSGNICVPISKDSGEEIIAENLRKTKCSAIFYSSKCKKMVEKIISLYPEIDGTLYLMNDLDVYRNEGRRYIAEGNNLFFDITVSPEDPSAIYFTSGTTGSQKGVIISHGNFAFDIQSNGRRLHETITRELSFVILPLTHTLSFATMCCIFLLGKRCFISKGLKYFFKEITEIKPDLVVMVPLFLEMVYKEAMSEIEAGKRNAQYALISAVSNFLFVIGIDIRRRVFKQIREKMGGNLTTIVTGGAPVSQTIVDEFHAWGIDVVVGYGLTECSPIVAASEYRDLKPDSVGKPLDGITVVIDNPDDNGIGEVCVQGPTVMKGYCNDEAATDYALRGGVFHTGDLGYLDKDGYLFLTGRSKNLIILSNGENISPEYLENKFTDQPIVKEIVVYQKDNTIVAEIFPNDSYVTKNNLSDAQSLCEQVTDRINKTIPTYARIGKVIVRKEEFPKNSSNKIIRDR